VNECQTIQEQLFELRDGDLDAAAAEAARAHLTACARCRAAAAFDTRLEGLLRSESVPPAPTGLAAEIKTRLRRRRRASAIAYATAAALIVAGAIVLWWPWNGSQVQIVESNHTVATPPADEVDVAVLFEPPPVDSLDVLNRQQTGYVTALRRMGEE
jgi:anti-sigma factor (TIGR02949 family)